MKEQSKSNQQTLLNLVLQSKYLINLLQENNKLNIPKLGSFYAISKKNRSTDIYSDQVISILIW
jgi:hypothetical protein